MQHGCPLLLLPTGGVLLLLFLLNKPDLNIPSSGIKFEFPYLLGLAVEVLAAVTIEELYGNMFSDLKM